jgi:chaperonin GroES
MKRRKTVVAKKGTAKKVKAKKSTAKKTKPAQKVKSSKPVKKAKPAAKKKTTKKAAPKKATAPKKKLSSKTSSVKPVKTSVDYTKAITPLGDRLVIRLVQSEKITPAGLILLDSATSAEGYLKGEVLATGHGTYTKKGHHQALDVKVGDTVLFNEYSSTKVKFNNEDLHIVHENEVLGVAQ